MSKAIKMISKRLVLIATGLIWAISSPDIYANVKDQDIMNLVDDAERISIGKKLFEQVCASCHGRDLSGATGFNLKDGEWIHGSAPTDILHSIKNGFMNAGMPGFKGVYSESQLHSIVAYILSKREGFENLTYKIYQMDDSSDRKISQKKLIKSGQIANNFADFRLPEVNHYILEFEGDFYTPKDEDSKMWVQWGKPIELDIEVNGKKAERRGNWNPSWLLARGKQKLRITYYSGTNKPNQRNVSMVVTNADMSIKLFPVSEKGREVLSDIKYEVIATSKPIIQRKKIHRFPAYSISVGMPSKMNFAFNTRTCSVVGVWTGDMLNIGPNINGRGEDGSLPLGSFLFRSPDSLQHKVDDTISCDYLGYELIENIPVFSYRLDDVDYQMSAQSKNQQSLSFQYKIVNQSLQKLTLSLPHVENYSWATKTNELLKNQVDLLPDENGTFSVSIQKNN